MSQEASRVPSTMRTARGGSAAETAEREIRGSREPARRPPGPREGRVDETDGDESARSALALGLLRRDQRIAELQRSAEAARRQLEAVTRDLAGCTAELEARTVELDRRRAEAATQ